ncbi:MAG: hypothetical protein IT384_19515 [Deltaproteobacteria bacterium]|nr:hypothetical protein [Deltaproteobacteria bacterium]
MVRRLHHLLWALVVATGCVPDPVERPTPAGDTGNAADVFADAAPRDAAHRDAAAEDATGADRAEPGDGGSASSDAAPRDALPGDASPPDAVAQDAATADASIGDGAAPDGAAPDAAARDAAVRDAGIDLTTLSDEFEGVTLAPRWTTFRGDVASVRVAGGALELEMTAGALWFQGGTSVMVYQEVTGDFSVEAPAHARRTSALDQPPSQVVHLGGLIARNPASATENHVFITVGFDEVDLSVETKTTVDSVSTYVGPPWPSGDAELRLCRQGAAFRLYKRGIGAPTWQLAETYSRPDLPATLQVGAIAYALGTPDFTVRFDALRFQSTCN